MSREELDRLGARYDGVEILHVDPGPEPGSPLEKRAIRQVGLVFTLAGALRLPLRRRLRRLGLVPPRLALGDHRERLERALHPAARPAHGPVAGSASASAWCSSPRSCCRTRPRCRTSTTARTSTGSPPAPRWSAACHNSGLARRKLITRSLRLHGRRPRPDADHAAGRPDQEPEQGQPARHHDVGQGRAAGPQRRHPDPPRRPGARLAGDGLPGRPGRQPAGRRRHDAHPAAARAGRRSSSRAPGQAGFGYGEYVAYSKICTHAGCPVSLYEQETSRILCPCHQSQFHVTQGAKPVFGPATRPLPQLPIEVDDEGYFVARSDYIEAVGPTYWNRERI